MHVNIDFKAADLSVPETAVLAGTVSLPSDADYDHTDRRVAIEFNDNSEWIWLDSVEKGPWDAFQYAVPVIPRTSFQLYTAAVNRRRDHTAFRLRGLLPGTPAVHVQLKSGASLSAPLPDTKNVDHSTQFLWTTNNPLEAQTIVLQPADLAGHPYYVISQTGSTMKIPDLRHLGIELPTNALYGWQVRTYYPGTDMEGLATAAFWWNQHRQNGGTTSSTFSPFTTKASRRSTGD